MAPSLRSISSLRSGLVALLLAGGACADDAPSVPTTSDTDSGSSTTGDSSPPETTVDPDDTRGEESTTRGEDTTMGDTTMGDTTDGETTDGAMCGNGTIEGDEQCDTRDLDGEDCVSQGFAGGALGCADDCTFDTSSCTAKSCGNDAIEGAEVCDGSDLGGESCQTQGFDGGTLGCTDDCTALDTSSCTVDNCGNGAIDAGETCDGAALGGETCVTQGFGGGNLACEADCLGYDTSGCMGVGMCTHDICVEGEALVAGCDPCVTQICAVDAFCCDAAAGSWDGICVDEVGSICGTPCGAANCGNGALDPGEDCEGANLNGQTCVTLGFVGGNLACAGDCSFDTAGCMGGGMCTHDICVEGEALVAGCDPCVTQICAADAFCCDAVAGSWDGICVDEVGSICGTPCGGGGMCAHDICTEGVALEAGCDPCVSQICAADAFCCDAAAGSWDGICVDEVGSICGTPCGGGAVCGDGAVTAPEVCDGANLNGQTCVTQGFMGGNLACAANCSSFNTAGCMGAGACAHDICMEGVALVAGCDPCVTQICAADAFCCDAAAGSWDGICVDEVGSICGTPCGGGGACAHDICVEGVALEAGCDPCVGQICAADAFCCDAAAGSWDGICVDEVGSICGTPCP